MDNDDAVTASFRQAAAYTILSVAPALAARYVTHARLRSSACSFPDSCRKCGTYLFNGSATIRVVRLSKSRGRRQPRRAIRTTCLLCGHISDIELHKETEALSGQSVNQPVQQQPCHNHTPISTPSPSSFHESSPRFVNVGPLPGPGPQRSRQGTVKAGLQDLLARNRRRKTQDVDQSDNNLAAFLKGL